MSTNSTPSFPFPYQLKARVTVKVGKEFSSCRSTQGDPFDVDLIVDEGASVPR
jgi:hypothetical protein